MKVSKKVIEKAKHYLCADTDDELSKMIEAIAKHEDDSDLVSNVDDDSIVVWSPLVDTLRIETFLDNIGYGDKDEEMRVFLVDIDQADDDFNKDCDDETFMTQAEMNGSVYSLSGFQEAFNNNEVSTENAFIRFILCHEQ